MITHESDAYRAVDLAARESHRRLVAFLASRCHDLAAAEDALADAYRAALETWPKSGVPEKPEAWLLTSARFRLIDAARHAEVHANVLPSLLSASNEAFDLIETVSGISDERVKLLFVCAHPAIDKASHAPLMLQTVLGLDAARIASAFLVKPSTMGQRLSRAKAKIRDAGIPYEVPALDALPPRLHAVLEAVYAAFGSGWEDYAGIDKRKRGLVTEAIELAEILNRLLPNEPEVLGLLALMLHCEARRPARRSLSGAYVPLPEQDTSLWSTDLIHRADCYLATASKARRPGRFQLEAAIQSVHAHRAVSGETDWQAIGLLYEGLIQIAPSIGALLGQAAAVAETRGPDTALLMLQNISNPGLPSHQPFWALKAHLLERTGQFAAAATAYNRAIGLCSDPATRTFLTNRLAGL